MDIKVNVPRGFVARYEWVDGDLVITIEAVVTAHQPKGSGKRYAFKGHSHVASSQKGKVVAPGRGPVVVTVDTTKRPTVARSGTGSTGPRKPKNV